MKARTLAAVAGGASAVLLCATPALADENWENAKPILEIPFLSMLELWSVGSVTFSVNVPDDGKGAIGFLFEGTWMDDGAGDQTWWASDLQFNIVAPNGKDWTVGGWDSPNDENWKWPGAGAGGQGLGDGDFIGPAPSGTGSNDGVSGPLSSAHFPWKDEPKSKEGLWEITFTADFKSDLIGNAWWEDITISLLNAPANGAPAPGALALLALAGLAGVRRARRS